MMDAPWMKFVLRASDVRDWEQVTAVINAYFMMAEHAASLAGSDEFEARRYAKSCRNLITAFGERRAA